MVVLHGDLIFGATRCVTRGDVVGMNVVGDDLRLHAKQAAQVLDAMLVRAQRIVVRQVADMLAHEGMPIARQAKGVLQLGAGGEQRRR